MLQTQYTETLTKVGLKYMQDPKKFKATKIFPMCPVSLMSSTFPTYDKEYWFKNEAQIRVPGTESTGSRHGRGTDNYSCQDVSHHEDVPDEYILNDPAPLNPLKAATRRVSQIISTFDEVDWVTRFLTTSVWTDASAPTTRWDVSTSTPLEDIDSYKRTMEASTSMEPKKAVMSKDVFDVLKRHAQVKDQVKYTSAQNITAAMLAAILELDELVVLTAVYDSAAYGATASMAYVASNKFLLLHTTDNPSLESPSAGYNFAWAAYGKNGYKVVTKEQVNTDSMRVEVHNYHDMKKIAADLGLYVTTPLT